MSRVLKFCGLSYQNFQNSSLSIQQVRRCSLCNRTINVSLAKGIPQQQYSTNISLHFSNTILKKKKPKSRGKFTELLEVSENHTNLKRTKVRKIGAKDLSILSEVESKTRLLSSSGEESGNCQGKAVSVKDDGKEILEESVEMEEEGTHEQDVFLDSMRVETPEGQSSILAEIDELEEDFTRKRKRVKIDKDKREKLAKIKSEELEKLGRERSFQNSLISYLELCNACSYLNRAWVTLQYYLNSKSSSLITSPKVFEVVMEGFAKHGKVDKVLELGQIAQKLQIKQTINMFSATIEAIARSPKHNKHELLASTLRSLEKQGFKLNDLFIDGQWKGDSREVTLGAVRAVHPSFSPVVPAPQLHYSNPLLDHMNQIGNLKSPSEGVLSQEKLLFLFKKQIKMEREFLVNIMSIGKLQSDPADDGRVFSEKTANHYRNKLDELKMTWEKSILEAFHRDLSTIKARHKSLNSSGKQINLYPYLTVLDKNEYKDIIMHEIRKLAEGSETFSPSVNLLYKNIGNQVKLRYEMKIKCDSGVIKKMEKLYAEYCKWYLDPSKGTCNNSRQQWQTLVYRYQHGPCLDFETQPWPNALLQGVGKFLYNIIMRDIRIDVNIFRSGNKTPHLLPAFYSVYRNHHHLTVEEVKPHPVLCRLFRAASLQYLTFRASEVPMVSPPIPWTSPNNGGYILAKTNMVRLPNFAVQQLERISECPNSQLYPSYDSLNQLASVPWKVNKKILDTVIELFNSGGDSRLDIPEPPSVYPSPEPVTQDMNQLERFQAYKQRMVMRRRKAEMYSLWCDALYKLSLANHFRDEIFWLPHNMDFRGRVYPCPPHLNHLGSDMARSLLVFAKGEPLGEKGLDWLKIHLVNLTGTKKKSSMLQRLSFANEMMPEIMDSANNPLNGKRWWVESEEPWQTLACCVEIRDALSCPAGPERYVSHFPVHQDGSCNGLQHYAALGRDKAGAHSVNLAPSDLPQDVYSCVVAIVERERAADAKNGVPIAQILEGFVNRKVIKQTVMTTVYGVTRFGGRLQIAKQLKDIEEFPKEYVWPASTYLVSKTFTGIREVFTSAREIQDWFTDCARMIAQICGQNVEYVTPLGLPVVQPYVHTTKDYKSKSHRINEHYSMDMFERPSIMKQKNAFPPNFIHSLDSCHMILTSLHCEQAGITFVSVHDCFWTHACSVEIMNQICREQFVSLHSQPILKDLSDFLVKKFSFSKEEISGDSSTLSSHKQNLNSLLKRLPSKGDFDLKEVISSVYFFS